MTSSRLELLKMIQGAVTGVHSLALKERCVNYPKATLGSSWVLGTYIMSACSFLRDFT